MKNFYSLFKKDCQMMIAGKFIFVAFQLSLQSTFLMLLLISLSAFVAALIGLFISKFSENLMVGVVYIKVVMIVFMAVPLLSYLLGANGLVLILCYFVPPNATFEGVMNLANSTDICFAINTCVCK